MKIKLDICLIFDAQDIWQSTEDFESDFANFLLSKGLLGEKVQCAEEESDYYRLILVSKTPEPVVEEKVKSPAMQKRDINFKLSKP